MAKRVGKFFKRIFLVVASVLLLCVVLVMIGLVLLRRTPQWYRLPQFSAEEREAAAQSATNKLAMVQNEVARARAQERAARTTATQPARKADGITISFTDRELNAFFDKWATWNNWKRGYEQYLTDPVVVLRDGRLVLAARAREMGTIISLHFRPRIDEHGKLHLELERVLGGRLPLPESVFSEYRRRLVSNMHWNIPHWRAAAELDRSGTPNTSAVAAAMGTLLIQILDQKPGEPLLFLPLVDQGSVAVKLTDIRIEDREITFTVQPLSTAERQQMLQTIRGQ